MKKFILTLALLLIATPAFAWNLFFIDQMENIAAPGEDEVMGFVLGDYKVHKSSVVIIKTVGAISMFIYTTKNNALAQAANSIPEFRGYGYIDMIWRVALGIGNGTINEMKHITGAKWWVPAAGEDPGHWAFGCVHDWEAAGSPEPSYRCKYRDILGINLD